MCETRVSRSSCDRGFTLGHEDKESLYPVHYYPNA